MAKRALPDITNELVIAALNGLAERAANADASPGALQHVAGRWQSMSDQERDDIAKFVAIGVQAAIGAIPVVIAAATNRGGKAADDEPEEKDKKRKKKKKDKKKDKKKKKKGKKKR